MSNSVLMIELERFRAGDLPMVCVRTGTRASHFVSIKSRRQESYEGVATLHRSAPALGLRALTDVLRPTGLLPFALGKEDAEAVTAYYVRKAGVELHGVHPAFVAAYEAMVSYNPDWMAQQVPAPAGPLEQVTLGNDAERAAQLVAELLSEGFLVTYSPTEGTQRIQVRESQLRHLSTRLASLAPDILST